MHHIPVYDTNISSVAISVLDIITMFALYMIKYYRTVHYNNISSVYDKNINTVLDTNISTAHHSNISTEHNNNVSNVHDYIKKLNMITNQ